MRAPSLTILAVILAASIAMPALADEKPHADAEPAATDILYAKSGDGFLGMHLDAGSIVLAVMDADKKPVAIKEGTATMFLTYVEDGHKSKVDLKLETGAEGSAFKAPLPSEGHGPTKAVAKVTADGKSHQASFEFEMPKAGK